MALAEKTKQRLELLKIAIDNEAKLSNNMSNYDNGIIPISDTRSVYDTRTSSEKRMDKNLIRNNFRQKVFSLFNNDPEDANEFIENFNEDDILLFDSVYNQLKKTFSGSNQSPQVILNTTYQLMNNLDQTGVISQTSNNRQTRAIIDNISEIKDFIENQYKNKNMSKSTGDSMMHVLDAITAYDNFDYDTLKLSSKWTNFKQKIQPFVNEIIEIMISNNDNKINNINIIFQNVRDLLKKTIDSLTPEEIAEIQAKSKAEAQEKVTSVSNKKIKADEKVTNRQIKADKKEVGAVMESLLKSVVNKAKAEAKAEPKAKAKPKAEALKKEAEEKERKKNNKKQVSNAATPQKKKK